MIFEIFALFCVGYVVGLSTLSGMRANEVKKRYILDSKGWDYFAWAVLAFGNIICASLGIILIFVLVVMAEEGIDRVDFWPRAVSFAVGTIVGISLTVTSSILVDRRGPVDRGH